MKALVTGSAGFVGRHMVAELVRRGWTVRGCDPRDTLPSWREDVRAVFNNRVEHLADTYDLVVHCAYHVGGRAAIDGEPRNLARNLELDAALFDWAVESEQRAVLYFSSSAAYPVRLQTAEWVDHYGPHRLVEDDICLHQWSKTGDWSPDARYGWAKLTGEHLARAAAETGLRVHVVRPFSGYGADQDPAEYPFPAIARRVLAGDGSVWGPPGQCRDWIHIDDVVAGALAVYGHDERRPVNLCSGVAVEFGNLVRWMARAAGRTVEPRYQPDRPTGVMCRVGDPARMLEHHPPRVSLEDGILQVLQQVGGQ